MKHSVMGKIQRLLMCCLPFLLMGYGLRAGAAAIEMEEGNGSFLGNIENLVNYYGNVTVPDIRVYLVILIVYFCLVLPGGYAILAYLKKLNFFKAGVIVCSGLLAVVIYLMGSDTRFDNPFYYYYRIVETDEAALEQETVYVKLQSPYNGSYSVHFPADYRVSLEDAGQMVELTAENEMGEGNLSDTDNAKLALKESVFRIQENLLSENVTLSFDSVRSFEEKQLLLVKEHKKNVQLPCKITFAAADGMGAVRLENVSADSLIDLTVLTEDGYYYLTGKLESGESLELENLSPGAWDWKQSDVDRMVRSVIRSDDGERDSRAYNLSCYLNENRQTMGEREAILFCFAYDDASIITDADGTGYTLYSMKFRY